jgi:hypothetical protein
MRDLFEFYCSKNNGGCGGFVTVPLDIDEERDIIMVCPNCKHEHYRGIRAGEITERRHGHTQDTSTVHRLEPTAAAYSREPRLKNLEARGPLGNLWARFGGAN